jgi:AcrR family transcriptional regulator
MSIAGPRNAAASPEEARRENKLGQTIRVKGAATERNLMQATLSLLKDNSPLNLSVHRIAREAGTSPATFYNYFKSVREVILALVQTLHEPYMRDVLPTLQEPWQDTTEDHVRRFVSAYFAFWDKHRRLLAVRNLEADLGDQEFIDRRIEMAQPVVDALCERIRKTGAREMPQAQAWAQAVVCCAAMEEMFSYPPEAYRPDTPATPEDIVEAQIMIIVGLLQRNSAT